MVSISQTIACLADHSLFSLQHIRVLFCSCSDHFQVVGAKALLTCVSQGEENNSDGEKVAQHKIQVLNIVTLKMCDNDFRVTIHPKGKLEIFF